MSAIDVFAAKGVDITGNVTTYEVQLRFRHLLVGGVPANPSVIRNWLKARMDLGDQALEEIVERTMLERFADKHPETDEVLDELMKQEDLVSVNGFKRNAALELCLESRCIKAGLREWANSAYPGTDWDGKKDAPGISKRKGLMSTLEERIFVPGTLVSTGVSATELSKEPEVGPAWVEERVKHVQTPQGPKSAISRVEVIRQPTLTFQFRVHDDFLGMQAWGRILQRGEDIGLGSDRGRSDGQYDLLSFESLGTQVDRLETTADFAATNELVSTGATE